MFFYNAFRALAFNGIAGDYAEFGCWSGATFAMAHMESRRRGHSAHLWAFDSFQGLPPQRDPEDDNMAADDSPRDIALAYVDCDLYSSTMSVMRFLMPRLKHGMIIAFDDYFCWSSTQISGERRAMLELLGNHETWGLLPYQQFGGHGQAFVVEDKLLLP